MTNPRKAAMEAMKKLVLGDQYGDDEILLNHNTHWANELLDAYRRANQRIQKAKEPAQKLNLAFGFAFQIECYDTWMNDHESGYVDVHGGGKMVKSLAGYFRRLLKKNTRKQLRLDDGYSYDGIFAFLDRFKANIEGVDTYGESDFQFNLEQVPCRRQCNSVALFFARTCVLNSPSNLYRYEKDVY